MVLNAHFHECLYSFNKAQFEQLENEMKDSNANFEAMKKGFLELTELKHMLRKTQVFFEEVRKYATLKMRSFLFMFYSASPVFRSHFSSIEFPI